MWLSFHLSVRSCERHERFHTHICLCRRTFVGVMPRWRRFRWVRYCVTEYHECSLLSSDTYDVYYMNPALLPPFQAEPAEETPEAEWTLDSDRGDATVEDICDFIVEYINRDVMVCSSSIPVLWCSCLHLIHRASWRIGISLLLINRWCGLVHLSATMISSTDSMVSSIRGA
jgi:hypothetical protein